MIIAISGGTGSGKTTVANEIATYIKNTHNLNVLILSIDNYYKNIHKEQFDNYDHPNAFNMDLLCDDLERFEMNQPMKIRKYDFETKESNIVDVQDNIDVIILEGLYAFYDEELKEISKIKIFIDVDESVRFQRRIQRDKIERGISEDENLNMLNSFVKDMHEQYVQTQIKDADLILKEDSNLIEEFKTIYKF